MLLSLEILAEIPRQDNPTLPLIESTVKRYWQTRTHCCGHIVADTNVSPFARARNICCGHKFCVRNTKMFLILFRNILCPQQMFPSLRAQGNVVSNNVSVQRVTMCPRLPPPKERPKSTLPAHVLTCSSHVLTIAVSVTCIDDTCLTIPVYWPWP